MVVLLLLWWLQISTCFSSQLPTIPSNIQCFQYVLENECTSVLGNVSIEESEQQDFFDQYVSLKVSDVRMTRSSCRRPFLSYFCQLVFGGFSCEPLSSPEEQTCFIEEYCLQVSDACSDYFELECNSSSPFSPSPSPSPSPLSNCERKVDEAIENVSEIPIAVEACLNSSRGEIECCFDPFVFDDNDECVVECPQFFFRESSERRTRIISLVLFWCGVFALLVATIPIVILTDMRYPNYVFFVSLWSYCAAGLIYMWSVFDGGPTSYICNGEKNYYVAEKLYSRLTRTSVQAAFYIFFSFLSITHWAIFGFNLVCHSCRPFTSRLDVFVVQPVKLGIRVVLCGGTILFSFSISLVFLIYGLTHTSADDPIIFFPVPVFYYPVPNKEFLLNLFRVPTFVFGSFCAIFLLFAVSQFARRGKHILYFQWRSIFVCILGCIYYTFTVILYFRDLDTEDFLFDYEICVATHPRTDPPPCKREYRDENFFLFYFITNFGLEVFFVVCLFWTNPLVKNWWRKLILSRTLVTSQDQLGLGTKGAL